MKLELLKTDFQLHCENKFWQRRPFGCSMYCFAMLFNNPFFIQLIDENEKYRGMTREDENDLFKEIHEANPGSVLNQISPLGYVNAQFGHIERRLVADILETNEKEFDSIENKDLLVPLWLTVRRNAKDEQIHRVVVVIAKEFYYLLDPMLKFVYRFTNAETFSEFYQTFFSVERLMIRTESGWKYGFLKNTVNDLQLI